MRIILYFAAILAITTVSAFADCKPRFGSDDKGVYHPVPATSEDMALANAWQTWSRRVSKKHGKVYSQLAYATKKDSRCGITGSDNVVADLDIHYWRCKVSAYPCTE